MDTLDDLESPAQCSESKYVMDNLGNQRLLDVITRTNVLKFWALQEKNSNIFNKNLSGLGMVIKNHDKLKQVFSSTFVLYFCVYYICHLILV